MADKGDDKEEPKGKALGKGDFERPGEEPSGEPEGDDDITTGDVDKVFKQVEHGISDDEWNKVPPKVKKAFRSKVTKIYSTMKKLDDNREYDKLEKMEEKFGLQLWQAKGLYDDFVEGDAGPEFDEPEGDEEPSGEPKTFDDIKNHHSKAVSAQDKVNDMIDKHNADHQMQDDDYEKWEDKREELKAIENELQALTVDDPNDSSYDGYKKGQKELTKQYISTLNKLSPDAKKILNKEEGRTGTEEIKVINGKKYRAIQESVNKRISVKEVHKWLKGLEEYRYRKIPGVDARRITSFVNNGLSETDLPKSLQKKWESAKYSREKHLADKFVKERISRKLARNESNHPLKEQYNKLFKNKVVL